MNMIMIISLSFIPATKIKNQSSTYHDGSFNIDFSRETDPMGNGLIFM